VYTRIRRRVAEQEKRIRREFRGSGRTFLGAHRILGQSPFHMPSSKETRRGLSPRIATRDKWKRIESIARDKEFHEAYQDARRQWTNGNRNVIFPAGTYRMRVVHAVLCAPET
jgi:hypothetical protein